ncbi:MAG: aa3-type cytochrome c oxidase subunit IV [Tropicimonas sp.]
MSAEKFTPGSMDISVQEKTFHGFITMAARAAVICILVLLFIGIVNG